MNFITSIASGSFDFVQFFNLQDITSGDGQHIIKAVAVLVLNIFLQVVVVFEAIAKVLLSLIK